MPERRIVITEEGSPAPSAPRPQPEKVDLQDSLLAGGVALAELAGSVIWWPSALILGCLFCFAFAYLIERSKRVQPKPKHGTTE